MVTTSKKKKKNNIEEKKDDISSEIVLKLPKSKYNQTKSMVSEYTEEVLTQILNDLNKINKNPAKLNENDTLCLYNNLKSIMNRFQNDAYSKGIMASK